MVHGYGTPSALVMTRVDGAAVYEVNQAFLDLTGYAREEVIGRPSRDLMRWGRWETWHHRRSGGRLSIHSSIH